MLYAVILFGFLPVLASGLMVAMLWSGMFLIDDGLLKDRYVPSAGGKRQCFPYEFSLVILALRGFSAWLLHV